MISKQSKTLFLILVVIQAFHSAEEYIGKLWMHLKSAEAFSTLLAADASLGFILINTAFFLLGLWVYLFAFPKEFPFTKYLIYFWVIIELLNGIAHPIIAVSRWEYIPGLLTSPALFAVALALFLSLNTRVIYRHPSC